MSDLPPELATILPAPIAERLKRGDFSTLDQCERASLAKWLPRHGENIPQDLRTILEGWWAPNRLKMTDGELAETSDWLAKEFQAWLKGYVSAQEPASTPPDCLHPDPLSHFDAQIAQVEAKLKALDQRTGGQYSALCELRDCIGAVLEIQDGERTFRNVDEAKGHDWATGVKLHFLETESKVHQARSRLIETGYDVPDEWLVADATVSIKDGFHNLPRARLMGEWFVKVSGPQDREALCRVWREIDAAILRMRCAPESKADPPAPANVSIQAGAVNVTTPSVNLAGAKAEGEGKPARRSRLKRAAVEPLILQHLRRRPYDTAKEVSTAVGCSVGVVGESPPWKANRLRLRIAAQEGRDPKAIRSNTEFVNKAGGSARAQSHDSAEDKEAIDEEVDRREQVLAQRIGEYLKQHPDATPREVARALSCTAGEVERRQAALEQLSAGQDESAKEDGGGRYFDERKDPPPDEKRGKWIRPQV